MQKSIPIQHTRRKNLFPYEIAIPCFNAPEIVNSKTLVLCRAYGIPSTKITLFVETKEKEILLKQQISRKLYGRVVVSQNGISETYTYIYQFYPPGTQVVCMYEECMWFIEYDPERPTRGRPLRSLLRMFRQGFEACTKAKTIFWGIYPIAEAEYFKKHPIQTTLCYTSPAIWGIQIPFCQLPIVSSSTLHHYERILQLYTQYNSIIRLNHVACRYTPQTSEPVSKYDVEALLKKYPEYITLEGTTSIHLRLHDRTKD